MQLLFSFLANGAEVSSAGKFFVFNGGVDGLDVQAFPTQIPMLAVVTKFRLNPDERTRAHIIELRGLRPNGEELFPVVVNTFDPTQLMYPMDRPASHVFAVNIVGLILYEQGAHRFVISADGEELGAVELHAYSVGSPTSTE